MPNPAKPPTSVRSIRLPDSLWATLQSEADASGISLNRHVAMRLDGARRDARNGAKVIAKANEDSKLVRALQDAAAGKVGRVVSVKVERPKPLVSRLKGEWKAP